MKLVWLKLNDLTVTARNGDVVGIICPKNGALLHCFDSTTAVEYSAGQYAKYKLGPWGNCTAQVMLNACKGECDKLVGIYRQAIVDDSGFFIGNQPGWKKLKGLRVITPLGSNWNNAPEYTGPTPQPEPDLPVNPAPMPATWTFADAATLTQAPDNEEDDEEGPELIWTRLDVSLHATGPISRGDIVGMEGCDLVQAYEACMTSTDGPDFGDGEGMLVAPIYWTAGATWKYVLKNCQETTTKKLYYYKLTTVHQKMELNAFHSQPAPLP